MLRRKRKSVSRKRTVKGGSRIKKKRIVRKLRGGRFTKKNTIIHLPQIHYHMPDDVFQSEAQKLHFYKRMEEKGIVKKVGECQHKLMLQILKLKDRYNGNVVVFDEGI